MSLEKGLPYEDQEIIGYIAARLNKPGQSIRDKGSGAQRTLVQRFVSNERTCHAQHGFLSRFHNPHPSAATAETPLRGETDDRRLREQCRRQCLLRQERQAFLQRTQSVRT